MLTVEIWSDVVCPFCYMGKRRFENGLREFEHRRGCRSPGGASSWTLPPASCPGQTIYEYLAKSKGIAAGSLPADARPPGGRCRGARPAVPLRRCRHRQYLRRAPPHPPRQGARETGAGGGAAVRRLFHRGQEHRQDQTLCRACGGGRARPRGGDDGAGLARHSPRPFGPTSSSRGSWARTVCRSTCSTARMRVSGAQPSELFLEVLTSVWEEQAAESLSGESPTAGRAGRTRMNVSATAAAKPT